MIIVMVYYIFMFISTGVSHYQNICYWFTTSLYCCAQHQSKQILCNMRRGNWVINQPVYMNTCVRPCSALVRKCRRPRKSCSCGSALDPRKRHMIACEFITVAGKLCVSSVFRKKHDS